MFTHNLFKPFWKYGMHLAAYAVIIANESAGLTKQ
jgi:hypothetical protein